MKWSKEWIDHSPDFAACILKSGVRVMQKGEECECGIQERHSHCKGCGRLLSRGSGKIIKEYKFNLRAGGMQGKKE